ncbi:MAG: hypothetical protein HFH14_06960 [Lachnospiraceae bacterium]|nr:hypothetical protein [Lachnospiraceae bacterium]
MKKFICPNCSNELTLDSADGMLTCLSCRKTIPITDFEHHEFGSIKNSQYIKKYADKNKDIQSDGFTVDHPEYSVQNAPNENKYFIPFELDENDVRTLLYKKLSVRLFFTHSFKNIIKKKMFEKLYVPVWSNEVMTKASISAACTEFDGNITNYYDVEKHAQLLFGQFNTTATTMNGTLHIDTLFPYRFDRAVCGKESTAKKNETDDVILLEADIPPDKYMDNIKKYADKAARDKLNTLLSSYSSTHNKVFDCSSDVPASRLIYLPVWKIPFGEKDVSGCLYVNGQTGKVTDRLPVSRLKCAAFITLTFVILFAVLITAAYFAGI